MHFTREQRESWTETTRDSPFNQWLRERTTSGSGGLDLQALQELAAEYGVDGSAYAHLNPGQQRMNIGNRLRRLVPSAIYMSAGDAAPTGFAQPTPLTQPEPSLVQPASNLPADASDRDLMRLYAAVIDELRERKVVRTGNAPLGDYAEHLFAKAFGWTLANNSAAGYDATDGAGLRFQIKARRLRADAPGERQLSAIRALPDAKFDTLAAVLFDKQFAVRRAALIPYATVVKRSAYIAHVNGWRMILDDTVWNEAGVRDVTTALAVTA